jgi:hypothetical protein
MSIYEKLIEKSIKDAEKDLKGIIERQKRITSIGLGSNGLISNQSFDSFTYNMMDAKREEAKKLEVIKELKIILRLAKQENE